ncbi:MAG TPA: phosphoribosylamine--glycine ligase [Pyrinomonadaceae bacterium]|nr:phosphoribosylamine--glycine ligase [Pyrinomonadaceae bacterium]
MKILIIGSGGREHAITWAVRNTSANEVEVYCAPGNAGIAHDATLVQIAAEATRELISFAQSERIDLTFVGPEAPLAAGIVDAFESEGVPIVGPTAAAARLEGSKVFAKDFMARHGIPTALYRTADSPSQALEFLRSGEFGLVDQPVVIKADGLAAGKGVVVASNRSEAETAIGNLMINKIAGSNAADRIVIEEALSGVEASVLLFTDGRDYVLMPPARDHKRIGEGDVGPNTGGMGSITDSSILDHETTQEVVRSIIEPTLAGTQREGFAFRGVLFLGLMLTANGPKLLEYNVRFGDPETQAILIRLKTDLLSIFQAIRQQTLAQLRVEWAPGASACVVAANRGYPGAYEKGAVIRGLDQVTGVEVFHAGTSRSADGSLIATGGRVLGITATAEHLKSALALCYDALDRIEWEGMQYRRDIGRRMAAGSPP